MKTIHIITLVATVLLGTASAQGTDNRGAGSGNASGNGQGTRQEECRKGDCGTCDGKCQGGGACQGKGQGQGQGKGKCKGQGCGGNGAAGN